MKSEKQKEKTRGGARPNAGRKKLAPLPEPPEAMDARGNAGKSRAASLIESLNEIDPQLIEDLNLRVEPEIEIPEDATKDLRKRLEAAEAARKVLIERKRAAEKKFRKLSFEVQGWADLWFSDKQALETRKYLYDKADGKAVQTINHLHDKPIEMNVNVSITERMKRAMEKAEARVHSNR